MLDEIKQTHSLDGENPKKWARRDLNPRPPAFLDCAKGGHIRPAL